MNQKLYYHRVGDSQEKDVLVTEFPENPMWRMKGQVSDCGKYLIVFICKDCSENLLYFADLGENDGFIGKLALTSIVTEFESNYQVSEDHLILVIKRMRF